MNKLLTPFPQSRNFLLKVAQEYFQPLKNHNCATCFFVAGGGKRTLIKFFLQEKSILKEIFTDSYPQTVFVYVDPDELLEMSNRGYLTLMLDKLTLEANKRKLPLPHLNATNPLTAMKTILLDITARDFNVIFLLNDFELTLSLSSSIYLNLEALMSTNKSKITYLFLSSINLLTPEILSKLHNLKYAVSQTVYYFPLFGKAQIDYQLQQIADHLHLTFSQKIKDLLIDLCGGHPQLLKYAAYNLAETRFLAQPPKAREFLRKDKQLHIVCGDIWNSLNSIDKEIVTTVIRNKQLSVSPSTDTDYLLNTKIVVRENGKRYRLFGELFTQFVTEQLPQDKLFYDARTNQIYFGMSSCSDLFTLQEFKLLTHLIQHPGKVVSRDEVAEVLWGKDSFDKYSDWTIDKIVSTVRKKLDEIGYPSEKMVTLKKRGISLTQ